MNKLHHAVLIIVFAIVLLACLLGTFFNWDFYEPESENRQLADAPDFRHTPFRDWPAELEAYFNDHFGFRNTFIRRYRKIMRSAGITDYRVIYGRDDWLYLNDEAIMQDFIGTRSYDESLRKQQVRRLQERKQWLENRGIGFLFFIVPNKTTIYPEYLPRNIEQLKASQTNREIFIERQPANLNQTVVDLTPILLRAKKDQVVYLKNDTHWNPYGAYIAYENIVDRIQTVLPSSHPPILAAQLSTQQSEIVGDLAKMTVSPERYSMKINLLRHSDKSHWSTKEIDDPEFLKKEHIPIDNKPPYTVHNPDGHGNAVILHDSFGLRLQEYLPCQFENTTFIWRYSNRTLLPLVVESLKPDIIIEQVVERHLIDLKNGTLLDDLDLSSKLNTSSHGL